MILSFIGSQESISWKNKKVKIFIALSDLILCGIMESLGEIEIYFLDSLNRFAQL